MSKKNKLTTKTKSLIGSIDFQTEKIQYEKLCNGELNDYNSYHNWKKQMIEKLSNEVISKCNNKESAIDMLEDSKHFLINEERKSQEFISSSFILLAFITFVASNINEKLFELLNFSPLAALGIKYFIVVGFCIWAMIDLIRTRNQKIMLFSFCEDIIEYFPEIEQKVLSHYDKNIDEK